MWNESEHPRDDDGKFVEKNGGYSALAERREKLRGVWVRGRNLTKAPSEEEYQAVVSKMGTDENAEWLDYNDFRNAKLTKEELAERIERNKAAYEAQKKEDEETRRAAKAAYEKKLQAEEAERREKIDKIKSNGENISDIVAQKLIDVVNRADDAYEKAMNNYKYGNASGGYVGNSRSVRATNAETDGKFPAGRAANILGITTMKLKKYLRPSEWHHTGALYNATDYYDISDLCDIAADLQGEDSAADIRKDYSAESIEKFEAIYGVKIK